MSTRAPSPWARPPTGGSTGLARQSCGTTPDVDRVVLGDETASFGCGTTVAETHPNCEWSTVPGLGHTDVPDRSGRWMVGDVFQDRRNGLLGIRGRGGRASACPSSERILVCLSRCRPALGRLDCRLHVEIDTPDLLASSAALHADT